MGNEEKYSEKSQMEEDIYAWVLEYLNNNEPRARQLTGMIMVYVGKYIRSRLKYVAVASFCLGFVSLLILLKWLS